MFIIVGYIPAHSLFGLMLLVLTLTMHHTLIPYAMRHILSLCSSTLSLFPPNFLATSMRSTTFHPLSSTFCRPGFPTLDGFWMHSTQVNRGQFVDSNASLQPPLYKAPTGLVTNSCVHFHRGGGSARLVVACGGFPVPFPFVC